MRYIVLSLILYAVVSSSMGVAFAENVASSAAEVGSAYDYVGRLKKLAAGKQYPDYEGYILAKLERGDYEDVDSYFAGAQAAYEAGTIDDITLRYAFSPVTNQKDLKYETYFDRWVEKKPQSYVARVAWATFHYNVAWQVRGSANAKEVSAEQFDGFFRELRLAQAAYKESLKLTPRPILSYMSLLLISGEAGALKENFPIKGTLLEADAIDPQNFWVKQAYLRFLQPRWGGSPSAMNAFVDYSEKAGLAKNKVDLLRSLVFMDLADTARYEEKNYTKALDLYQEAAALQVPYKFLNIGKGGIKGYIRMKETLSANSNYDDDTLAALSDLLEHSGYVDDAGGFYALLGHVYSVRLSKSKRKSDFAAAWKAFNSGMEMKDAYSTFRVASGYCEGYPDIVVKDEGLCRDIMVLAADMGSPEAAKVAAKRWAIEPKKENSEDKGEQLGLSRAAQRVSAEDVPKSAPLSSANFISMLLKMFF
ncbi:MAG: DUF4034 domain-containing protein [Pseudobdellovibrionaceae bacterium]